MTKKAPKKLSRMAVLEKMVKAKRAGKVELCPNGHPWIPENTYHPPTRPNERRCRECGIQAVLKHYHANKPEPKARRKKPGPKPGQRINLPGGRMYAIVGKSLKASGRRHAAYMNALRAEVQK